MSMSGAWAESPALAVTDELVATLVHLGGYTHPLFHPPPGVAGPPLPGQGVLLLMGGLVEQSRALDGAVALLELRRARFHAQVRAGVTLRVRIEPLGARTTSSGKVVQDFQWTAVDADGRRVVEVEAVMLMDGEAGAG
jgi:acyl dehydratase